MSKIGVCASVIDNMLLPSSNQCSQLFFCLTGLRAFSDAINFSLVVI